MMCAVPSPQPIIRAVQPNGPTVGIAVAAVVVSLLALRVSLYVARINYKDYWWSRPQTISRVAIKASSSTPMSCGKMTRSSPLLNPPRRGRKCR